MPGAPAMFAYLHPIVGGEVAQPHVRAVHLTD